YVYENLRLNEIVKHPDIESMLDALKEKNLYRLSALIENIMETVTAREYPVIEKIKEKMKENGALSSVMSGSGPTIYGIFDNQLKAETAYNFFKSSQYGKYVILTKPYNINQ